MNLDVRSLDHSCGDVVALQDLQDGEIVAVLRPSGSGKTTLLEILAGLLSPTAGEVLLDGRTISRPGYALAPERRNIGFVFQDFALWPHMTVAQTVGFPLAMRRMPERERQARVAEVLALVQLDGYGARYPHEISGGQRQRVAIARARTEAWSRPARRADVKPGRATARAGARPDRRGLAARGGDGST